MSARVCVRACMLRVFSHMHDRGTCFVEQRDAVRAHMYSPPCEPLHPHPTNPSGAGYQRGADAVRLSAPKKERNGKWRNGDGGAIANATIIFFLMWE